MAVAVDGAWPAPGLRVPCLIAIASLLAVVRVESCDRALPPTQYVAWLLYVWDLQVPAARSTQLLFTE